MEFAVVHLFADVDDAFEVVHNIEECFEFVVGIADVHNEFEHKLLAFEWTNSVDFVESVLLEDNEVDNLWFPECNVIVNRYTVVAEDVDLLLYLFTTKEESLHLVDHTNPVAFDFSFDIFFKFRVFDIFRVAIDRVNSRVAFAVGAVLFECVEATRNLFSTFSYRLFQVTTRRRYSTDECNRTSSTIFEIYITSSAIESTDDSREVHRECILTWKLFHTVRHLTKSLCPTRCRVGHKKHFQSHSAIVFGDSHRSVNRSFTRCNRHVWCISDDDSTLHEFATSVWVFQFRKLNEDFHNLVSTLTAGSHNYDVGIGLFWDSVLEHSFTSTERTRDETSTTFNDRVGSVDSTHTSFQQAERTWFFCVYVDSLFHRPFLNHIDIMVVAICVGNHGDSVVDCVLTSSSHRFHSVNTFHNERHHDFVRLRVFVYLAEPRSSLNFVAYLSERFEIPKFLVVEREVVFTTFEEYTCQFVEVVLKTIVVARKHTRTECYLEHVTGKFYFVANFKATSAFEYLYEDIIAVHFKHLGHESYIAQRDIANLILSHRTINPHSYEVGDDTFYFTFCCHYLLFYYLFFPFWERHKNIIT